MKSLFKKPIPKNNIQEKPNINNVATYDINEPPPKIIKVKKEITFHDDYVFIPLPIESKIKKPVLSKNIQVKAEPIITTKYNTIGETNFNGFTSYFSNPDPNYYNLSIQNNLSVGNTTTTTNFNATSATIYDLSISNIILGSANIQNDINAQNGNFFNGIASLNGAINFLGAGNISTNNIIVSSGGIVMVDELNNDNLLHTISGNLYFNNELLAKANDIQDIADWALYPAISDVNGDNKNFSNIADLTALNIVDNFLLVGTAGQVLSKSLDENKMIWGDLPPPPESVSSLNLLTGNVDITSTGNSITISTVGQNIDLNVNFPEPPLAVNSLNLLSGDVDITSTGNTVTISKVGQNINLETATPPPAGVATLNTVSGDVFLTSDGSVTITPNGQNIQLTTATTDITQWSNYGAVTNVNLNGNTLDSITGTVNITANKDVLGGVVNVTANGGNNILAGTHGTVNINATYGTAGALTTGGLINLNASSGFNDVTFTSAIKMSAAGVNSYAGAIPSVGSLAGYNFIYGTAGVNLCCGLPSIIPNIPFTTYLYGTNGIVLNSDVYTTNLYPYWNGIAAPTNLSINGRATISGRGYVNLNNVDTLNFETAGNGGTGAITGLQSINGVPYTGGGGGFVDSFQIYVAPNGNDTTGNGSQQNPYLTIGQAIIKRATISNTVEVSIIISSGTYTTASITLTRNTYLVGVQTGEARQPCNIVGNIILNDTTGTMGLSGLEITGSISTTGGGATYTFFGCNITNTSTAFFATAGAVFMTECRVSTSSGVVIVSFSTLTLRDCNISTSGTSSCISASSITTIRQCIILSSSSSTSVQPLLQLGSNSATLIVEFCRFEYTSTATDVAGNKCCIKFTNPSGTLSASISNSLLLCEGAITGSPQIQCIQDTGAGAVNLAYGQLIAGATAHNISPNTTKTQYNTVP